MASGLPYGAYNGPELPRAVDAPIWPIKVGPGAPSMLFGADAENADGSYGSETADGDVAAVMEG
jgi:hypothetical protein